MEGGLVSLQELAYINYSVPLVIKDQQGMSAEETLLMIVCDCGDTDVCLPTAPPSIGIGPAGVGLIILGLLLFLCEYRAVNGYINETTKFLTQ